MSSVIKREEEIGESTPLGVDERRVLRSRYLVVRDMINDEKDCIFTAGSDKFKWIFSNVENLYQLVQKPREQVADAQALLGLANTLLTTLKCQSNGGATLSDFVTSLLKNFGLKNGPLSGDDGPNKSVNWKKIGLSVSDVFKKGPGGFTMLGPMSVEGKQRRTVIRRKQLGRFDRTCPHEVVDNGREVKTDTDKIIATMFGILRKKRSVRLENLVLNRVSFAQTVENIFALSFLVKDGRVEIAVNDQGYHLVSPRNAPSCHAVSSGEVTYNHFVFKFDFNDWKLMVDSVVVGEELMPSRDHMMEPSSIKCEVAETAPCSSQEAGMITYIRKMSRNRGLIIQECSNIEDSPKPKLIRLSS